MLMRCFQTNLQIKSRHLWSLSDVAARTDAEWSCPTDVSLLQTRESVKSFCCRGAELDPCGPCRPGPVSPACAWRSRRADGRRVHRACLHVPETAEHTLRSPAGDEQTPAYLPPEPRTWRGEDHWTETQNHIFTLWMKKHVANDK